MTVLLTALAVMAPTPAPVASDTTAHQGCHTRACHERVASKACRRRGVVSACIHRAARRWNVSEAMLRRKAWCESRFGADEYNEGSGASGLFQFLPSTWRTTPYRWHSIWSRRWNSLAAAWMHHVGRGAEWSCR